MTDQSSPEQPPAPGLTGYCPSCGRGDVAPTAEEYEQQRQRAAQAEAAIERVRDYAADIERSGWTGPAIARRIRDALAVDVAPFTPDSALAVRQYRADDGSQKWAARCWGTGTCDGWLSLDHTSQQWAERARDRHVAEKHAEPGTAATQATDGHP